MFFFWTLDNDVFIDKNYARWQTKASPKNVGQLDSAEKSEDEAIRGQRTCCHNGSIRQHD